MGGFYHAYLNHFAQPDSIVPDQQNPQAWNRYAYALNNPIRYNDPTGHKVCSEIDLNGDCQGDRKEIQSAILEENNRLASLVEKKKMKGLEAFAQLAEYAASLTPNCTKCFVENMGSVLTGHSRGNYVWRELTARFGLGNYDEYYERANQIGQSGFADIFKDPKATVLAGGGDQPHHYWYYVQVGYESGSLAGNAGVICHETVCTTSLVSNSIQDVYLGYEGVNLGVLLAEGTVNPSDVGDYIRGTLSPSSAVAQTYQTHTDNVYESLRNPVPFTPHMMPIP